MVFTRTGSKHCMIDTNHVTCELRHQLDSLNTNDHSKGVQMSSIPPQCYRCACVLERLLCLRNPLHAHKSIPIALYTPTRDVTAGTQRMLLQTPAVTHSMGLAIVLLGGKFNCGFSMGALCIEPPTQSMERICYIIAIAPPSFNSIHGHT